MSDNNKLLIREKEKDKYRTPKHNIVTHLINKYKEKGKKNITKINQTLKSIFIKNFSHMISGKTPPIHCNLMAIVSNPLFLLQSYKKIRKNKGAMTLAYGVQKKNTTNLTSYKKE